MELEISLSVSYEKTRFIFTLNNPLTGLFTESDLKDPLKVLPVNVKFGGKYLKRSLDIEYQVISIA